jgi:ABC-type nickel/cobalt efflux system permease component RcnA/Tol biopolymer transport system component
MYAQNFTVTLSPEGMRLQWQILPGPFLADAVWTAADVDQSGQISAGEAERWIAPFVAGLSVRLDEQAVSIQGAQDVHWPSSVEMMRTAEDRIGFWLQFHLPKLDSSSGALEIHASHLEANSLNWFSVAAEDGLTFDEPMQDNGQLRVVVHSSKEAPAASRTTWNSGTPNMPALSAVVSQMASGTDNADDIGAAPASPTASVTDTLTGLVKTQEFTPLFLAGAFLLSLVLGSLHALTPGHGKALVGAYLVGSQGRTRDAVFLGAIVTITHTGSVLLLGMLTLFASRYILPALIAPWLEIISGVLVIGFGINLLFQRGGDLKRWRAHGRGESGGEEHAPDHQHGHPHQHGHHHHEDGGTGHTHEPPAEAVTMRSLLTLGVSGGLVPCPDAIAILLVAVAVNRIPFGMLLILAFSLGLALVLISIGVAMVNGVRLIARSEALPRFAIYAPVVSAAVVTVLGAALTVSAVRSLQFGAAVVQSAGQARQAAPAQAAELRLLYIAADSTGRDQLFMKAPGNRQPIQYTEEASGITGYEVSPDGKTIVYTTFQKAGGTALWAIDAEGKNRRLVLDCPRSECNSPRWYPDGKRLAYERLDDASEVLVPRFSIWWLDFENGETHPMFQDSALASYAPQFSPDGKWLSYISSADNTLIIFDLLTGESRSVPLGAQAVLPGSWGPESDAVLFGSQAEGERLQIKTYWLDSEKITGLEGPPGATDYASAWSPDGEWIAIDRSVPLGAGINSNQVWLVRPDGTDARAILQEPEASYSSLLWSADGRHLLYARYLLDIDAATPGRFDIYRTDVESGESELLVEGGDMPTLLQ